MKKASVYSRSLRYLANFMIFIIIAVISFGALFTKREWKKH